MLRGLILISAFCLSVSAELVCEDPVFDFGDRDEGETVQHLFAVKNTGTSEVLIERVRTSCGCTAASLSTNVVGAGESVEITVSLNLEGRTGPQDKKIRVYGSDSEQLLTLELNGNSRAAVEISPDAICFSNVQANVAAGQSIHIRSSRQPLLPGEPRCDSPHVRCMLTPGETENEAVLTATLLDSLPSGELLATITLPVFEGKKTLSIPVYSVSEAPPGTSPSPAE